MLTGERVLANIGTWAAMDRIPIAKSCRVIKLLNLRSFELKSDVHVIFDKAWKVLVQVDVDNSSVTISAARDGQYPSDSHVLVLSRLLAY